MDPQIKLDGTALHKSCAKCDECKCQITLSNFAKHETGDKIILLCKTHYFRQFREGGAYLGGEKFAKKQNREIFALTAQDQHAAATVASVTASTETMRVAEEPTTPVIAPLRVSPSRTKPGASWIKKVVVDDDPIPAPVPVPASYEPTYLKVDDPNGSSSSGVIEEEPLDDEFAQE
jgi:hypothetical protein